MNSKEEILKIQTCVLKVNIHCDGCKHKVKKILQKIDGVFTIKIESEESKVTVSGTVHPSVIIKKLTKSGKHAQLWPSPQKPPLNNLQLHDNNIKPHNQKGGAGAGAGNIPSGKGGAGGGSGGGLNAQQLQQLKGFQDLKLLPPQFKNMGQNQPPKAVAAIATPAGKELSFPEEEEEEEDEFSDEDEFDDEDEFSDDEDEFSGEEDEFSDEGMDDEDLKPSSKMKPIMGNHIGGGGGGGGGGMDNKMMMMNALMKAAADGGGGKIGNNNGGGKNGNNQKGGADGQNGGKKSSGGGGDGGGGGGGDGSSVIGGLPQMMNKGFPMGGGQNGHNIHIGQPAAGAGHGPNYFPSQVGPPDSPYLQQQQLAAMMNQRTAMAGGSGSDPRFQHMMYARPEAPVNYMPAYPYPYPYPNPHPHMHPAQPDSYTDMFNDENSASSCSVM